MAVLNVYFVNMITVASAGLVLNIFFLAFFCQVRNAPLTTGDEMFLLRSVPRLQVMSQLGGCCAQTVNAMPVATQPQVIILQAAPMTLTGQPSAPQNYSMPQVYGYPTQELRQGYPVQPQPGYPATTSLPPGYTMGPQLGYSMQQHGYPSGMPPQYAYPSYSEQPQPLPQQDPVMQVEDNFPITAASTSHGQQPPQDPVVQVAAGIALAQESSSPQPQQDPVATEGISASNECAPPPKKQVKVTQSYA